MTSTPSDAAFEAVIISACAEHERASRWEHDYRRCLVIEGVFVKFDSYRSLYPQVETQKYVFQCAKGDMNAPRVPEVLHFFHRDYQMAYVVMEYINLTPHPVPDLPKKVALEIQWLRDLPAPLDCLWFGPLGGGRVRHTLFKDYLAPLSFISIQAIERYLNTAIPRVSRRSGPLAPVSFSQERLVFTQSDMDESNFGVDTEGRTCLFDFAEVGLLPESFASYTMSIRDPFTVAVAQHLGWPTSSNISTMGKISSFLWIYYDPTLGLDDNGDPKRKRA